MSIATQITALTADKTAIASAITAKGGTVTSGDGFDDFATDIGTIPTGGGGSLPSSILHMATGSFVYTSEDPYITSGTITVTHNAGFIPDLIHVWVNTIRMNDDGTLASDCKTYGGDTGGYYALELFGGCGALNSTKTGVITYNGLRGRIWSTLRGGTTTNCDAMNTVLKASGGYGGVVSNPYYGIQGINSMSQCDHANEFKIVASTNCPILCNTTYYYELIQHDDTTR